MNLRKFGAVIGLSIVLPLLTPLLSHGSEIPRAAVSSDKPAAQKTVEENEITKDVRMGLKAWFNGDTPKAEEIFSQLVENNCENPVPYQALAIIFSDRHANYDRVTELYSRHKVLSAKSMQSYRDVIDSIREYAGKGSPQAQLLLARVTGWGMNGSINTYRSMLLLRSSLVL